MTDAAAISSQEPSEQLREEVTGGLLYCHSRLNGNTSKLLESASFLYALIQLLEDKGLFKIAELDEKKKEVAARLLDQYLDKGMGVAMQEGDEDKYSFKGTVEIDCENRIHLCKAACCRMSFALSQQDVEEGVIKWDLGRPYLIAQGEDGYCRHLDRANSCCTVRQYRPLPCRGYDCRNDKRVWVDFENKIINPELENLFTPARPESKEAR
jgi:hypothetical protein